MTLYWGESYEPINEQRFMNRSQKSSGPNSKAWWTNKRVVCIGLVLLAALYVVAQPKLEQWTGLDLPDLMEREEPGGPADNANPDGFKIDMDALKSGEESEAGFKLSDIGRGKFKSPEGLIYDEYRIDHVLRHTKDDTGRPVHGVFDSQSQTELLELLDQAYALVKAKDRAGKSNPQDRGRVEHVIDMDERVGYVGGQSGQKQNNPATKRMELILEGERVITAYPTWPPRRRGGG